MKIDFPKSEHSELQSRLTADKSVFTLRMSDEKGRYHEGAVLNSPFGKLQVRQVKTMNDVKDYPFFSELTHEQKQQLAGHAFDMIELAKAAASKQADGSPGNHTCTSKEGITYSVPTLWQLARELPVEKKETKDLLPLLKTRMWKDIEGKKTQALKSEDPYHLSKVEKANLRYPILVHPDGWVMDGAHRLVKAMKHGVEEVRVIEFPKDPTEAKVEKTSASKKEQERKLHILIKKLTHEGIPAERYSAKEGRRVLGHAILREPIKDKRKFKYLREIYTKPEYRKQGVAKKLVEKMREDYPKKAIIFAVEPFKDKPLTEAQLKAMYRKFGAKKHPSTVYDRMVFKPIEKAASFSGAFLDELDKIARTMEEGQNRFNGMAARMQADGGGLLPGDQYEVETPKEPQSEPSPRKPLENKRSQTHPHK